MANINVAHGEASKQVQSYIQGTGQSVKLSQLYHPPDIFIHSWPTYYDSLFQS